MLKNKLEDNGRKMLQCFQLFLVFKKLEEVILSILI